jgi:hypothetical protein
VKVHAPSRWVGDVGRVERRSELTSGELGSGVDVEDKSRVRHGENIELVSHDERRHVDFFVNHEFANLLQPRNVRGRQNCFKLVPTLAGVIDANGPYINGVGE